MKGEAAGRAKFASMNFYTVSSIIAMGCTAFATLVMIVFCLAGSANSTEAQLRTINLIMLGLSLLSVAGIAAGIFLLRSGHGGWALGASIAPAAIMFFGFIIALML